MLHQCLSVLSVQTLITALNFFISLSPMKFTFFFAVVNQLGHKKNDPAIIAFHSKHSATWYRMFGIYATHSILELA